MDHPMTAQLLEPKAQIAGTQEPVPPPYIFPADRLDWTVGDCLIEKALILMRIGKYHETYAPVLDEARNVVRGQMVQTLTFSGSVPDDYTDFMSFVKGTRDPESL